MQKLLVPVGGLMDAYSINHNGTTLISDAGNPPLQYITFPAGQRASNFVMYLPVHDIGDAVCNVAVWGIKLGTETATLNVSAKFIPDPTATAQSSTSGESNTRSMVISGGSSSTALTYDEVEITGCTVQGSGMLVAVVGCTNSANQVQLLRTGFRLSVAEASDTIVSNTGIFDIRQLTNTNYWGYQVCFFSCCLDNVRLNVL